MPQIVVLACKFQNLILHSSKADYKQLVIGFSRQKFLLQLQSLTVHQNAELGWLAHILYKTNKTVWTEKYWQQPDYNMQSMTPGTISFSFYSVILINPQIATVDFTLNYIMLGPNKKLTHENVHI